MRAIDAAGDVWTGDEHSRPQRGGARAGHGGAAARRRHAREADGGSIRGADGLTHIARADGGPRVECAGAVPIVRRGVVEGFLPDRGAHGRAGVVLKLHAGERGTGLRGDLRQNRRRIEVSRRGGAGADADDGRAVRVVGHVDARRAGVTALIGAVGRGGRDHVHARCERHGGGPGGVGVCGDRIDSIHGEAGEWRNGVCGCAADDDAVRSCGRVVGGRGDRDHGCARILRGGGGVAKGAGGRAIGGSAAIIIRRAAGEAAEGHAGAARRL